MLSKGCPEKQNRLGGKSSDEKTFLYIGNRGRHARSIRTHCFGDLAMTLQSGAGPAIVVNDNCAGDFNSAANQITSHPALSEAGLSTKHRNCGPQPAYRSQLGKHRNRHGRKCAPPYLAALPASLCRSFRRSIRLSAARSPLATLCPIRHTWIPAMPSTDRTQMAHSTSVRLGAFFPPDLAALPLSDCSRK